MREVIMAGTVLLADDSITIQKVVELTFAETDHTVVAVGSGRDLLGRIADVKPDVVLCDVVMPDMNGYDVCQSLKSDPATLHIPVVLLTGTFEPFDRDRALAAGCDAIVTKPFEARELISTVEDLLRRSEAVKAIPPAESESLPELGIPEGVPSLDFTTTGFERMVPAPPRPELPPDEGIELTSSSLGRSFTTPPPPAPPELAEHAGEEPGGALEFGESRGTDHAAVFTPAGEVPPAAEEAPWAEPAGVDVRTGAASEDETFPSTRPATPPEVAGGEAAGEVPELDFESTSEAPAFAPAPERPTLLTAPEGGVAFGDVTAGATKDIGSTQKLDLAAVRREAPQAFGAFSEPLEPVAVEPAPPPAAPDVEVPAVTEPVPAPFEEAFAPAESQRPRELTEEEIERIAQRVVGLIPPPVAPAVVAPTPASAERELSEEQLGAIATKVLERARPLLEQIAWETIPDMAEMIVRARIRELEAAAEAEN
ncbi:MAG: response regulator [Acidobacteriota bacterium]